VTSPTHCSILSNSINDTFASSSRFTILSAPPMLRRPETDDGGRSTPCFFRRDLYAAEERTDPSLSFPFLLSSQVATGAAFASRTTGKAFLSLRCLVRATHRCAHVRGAAVAARTALRLGLRRRHQLRRRTSNPVCALQLLLSESPPSHHEAKPKPKPKRSWRTTLTMMMITTLI
jgi:hypothetical protein